MQWARPCHPCQQVCIIHLDFFPFSQFLVMTVRNSKNGSLPNTNEYKCNICQKIFKNKAGLTRHNTIICKYNILQVGLPTVSKKLTKLFKNDLVYFIHRRLPNGFKNSGKKKSQYHAVKVNFMRFLRGIYIFILKRLVLISVYFLKRKEKKN